MIEILLQSIFNILLYSCGILFLFIVICCMLTFVLSIIAIAYKLRDHTFNDLKKILK